MEKGGGEGRKDRRAKEGGEVDLRGGEGDGERKSGTERGTKGWNERRRDGERTEQVGGIAGVFCSSLAKRIIRCSATLILQPLCACDCCWSAWHSSARAMNSAVPRMSSTLRHIERAGKKRGPVSVRI